MIQLRCISGIVVGGAVHLVERVPNVELSHRPREPWAPRPYSGLWPSRPRPWLGAADAGFIDTRLAGRNEAAIDPKVKEEVYGNR